MKGKFILIAVICLLTCALLIGCGSDNPASSKESVCERLGISSGEPTINFKQPCNSASANISGITYNNFGQVTLFNFQITCTSTSESYSGRAFNIKRNNVGNTTSFDATINGVSCSYP